MIGWRQITFAALLILGLWFPSFARPAAFGIALLMLGAVAMHLKVSDRWKKALPASSLLVLSLLIAAS